MSSREWFARETAVVDEGAEIGAGTKIRHLSHVSAGAKPGERRSPGRNVFVAPRGTVGNGVKIRDNLSPYGGVVPEDLVFRVPGMAFTSVRAPRPAFARDTPAACAAARVPHGAGIGASATIVRGAAAGARAFVAAGAVVTKEVPDFAPMPGVPARRIGRACACGAAFARQGESLPAPRPGAGWPAGAPRVAEGAEPAPR
jgi:UDP-2-acetamido-3-amino-2,3-dideoxy-glucuronate N-acetyltransferase